MQNKSVTTYHRTIDELVDNKPSDDDRGESPIPLNIFPNCMGINLCSVVSISWAKQNDDDQLLSLSVQFAPETDRMAMQDHGFVPDREAMGRTGRFEPKYRVFYEYPDENGKFPEDYESEKRKQRRIRRNRNK